MTAMAKKSLKKESCPQDLCLRMHVTQSCIILRLKIRIARQTVPQVSGLSIRDNRAHSKEFQITRLSRPRSIARVCCKFYLSPLKRSLQFRRS